MLQHKQEDEHSYTAPVPAHIPVDTASQALTTQYNDNAQLESNTSQQDIKQQSALEMLDVRLVTATAEERTSLLKARRELIEQNDLLASNKHKRMMEVLNTVVKFIALLLGGYLYLRGMTWPGGLCIGAALYSIAPEFVMKYIGKGKSAFKQDSEQENEQNRQK